jgi:hypothetical protein
MIRVPALHPSRPHATPCDTARDDPSQCPKMDTRHADGASGTTKWCLGSQMGVPELSPDDLRLRRRALWDALNSAGRRGVYRAGSRRGEDTRTFYERDESAMLRVRGGFSRPQTCSDQTSTKPTWWPQRDLVVRRVSGPAVRRVSDAVLNGIWQWGESLPGYPSGARSCDRPASRPCGAIDFHPA